MGRFTAHTAAGADGTKFNAVKDNETGLVALFYFDPDDPMTDVIAAMERGDIKWCWESEDTVTLTNQEASL